MDNLFEYIVPIIFAAIYFIGNMLSKKSDDDSAPSDTPRRGAAEDPDAVERQRRIQEEIRRKIMERRRATESGNASETAPRQESSADANLRERRAVAEQRRQQSHPESSIPNSSSRIPHPVAQANAFGDDMQAKLEQIEATKRRAEKLKKQAAASQRTNPAQNAGRSGNAKRARPIRGSVRSSLRDPVAARAAFIYGEVLGTPVSEKKASSVPGLVR
jgi:hypothetical protein